MLLWYQISFTTLQYCDCFSLLSTAVIKTLTKTKLGGLFHIVAYSPSLRKVKAENLEAETDTETKDSCLLACLATIFI